MIKVPFVALLLCLVAACVPVHADVISDELPIKVGGFHDLCDDICDPYSARTHYAAYDGYTHSTCSAAAGVSTQCWDEQQGGSWFSWTHGGLWQRALNINGHRAVYNALSDAMEFDQDPTSIFALVPVPTTCLLRYMSLRFSSEGYGSLETHIDHSTGRIGEELFNIGTGGNNFANTYERLIPARHLSIPSDAARVRLWVEGQGQAPRVHGASAWMTCPPEAS